jgi:hypothetical protein
MTDIKSFAATLGSLPSTQMMRIRMVLVALVLSGLTSLAQSNNVNQFEDLKQPRISAKKSQKMVVVEAKGDPNVIGGRAFGMVFQLYYRLPETPKGPPQAFPRARWPESLEAPKTEWTGLYALPVPETVAQLPPHETQEGLKASLATWEYGEVAEILHLGPYSREEPALKRLREFIREQGYVTLGGHEEEYIVGPSQGGKGDSEQYVTIIRYRVRRPDKK